MPLAFESLNRGVVAFGFFNIDTDLLLLGHYFFFADEFCPSIVQLAERKGEASFETSWDVYDIPRQAGVGDLMAAIHGVRYTGFIGEFLFARKVFLQLVEYVWLGGYPRWRDGIRPAYVKDMKSGLEKAAGWLTEGLVLR